MHSTVTQTTEGPGDGGRVSSHARAQVASPTSGLTGWPLWPSASTSRVPFCPVAGVRGPGCRRPVSAGWPLSPATDRGASATCTWFLYPLKGITNKTMRPKLHRHSLLVLGTVTEHTHRQHAPADSPADGPTDSPATARLTARLTAQLRARLTARLTAQLTA